MTAPTLALALSALTGIGPMPGFGSETITFDALKPGVMPPYWTATTTGGGDSRSAAHWQVVRDPKAPTRQNALGQVSVAGGDQHFPLAIYDKTLCRDGELSVKFKIAAGGKGNSAGIVFRYQDQNNYYLLSFSAGENRIGLFRVVNGQMQAIPISGAKSGEGGLRHEVRVNQWYVAKVSYQGNRLRVSFGNRRLFDAFDDGIRMQGKSGLWTRSGTLAEFDDFHIGRKS